MTTLNNWLHQSTLPRLEARLLAQSILKISHAQIITHSGQLLASEQLQQLNLLAQRRLDGEPIAYILGYKEFYGREFTVTPATLIPRPETEHLVDIAIETTPLNATVWELGTGSGIIAISLKLERPDLTIWASDISQQALDIARLNADNLQAKIHFTKGSWFNTQEKPPQSCQLIISNPPYIDADDIHLQQGDLRFEPTQALTDFADGLQSIREIICMAPDYLAPDGRVWLEHGYQQADDIRQIFEQYPYTNIKTIQDLAGLDRITGASLL